MFRLRFWQAAATVIGFRMADVDSKKPVHTDLDNWPNTVRTRAELDDALEQGRQSGAGKLNILQAGARAKERLRRRD